MKIASSQTKLKRSPRVSSRQVIDEIMILHHPTGNYFTLNPTGTAIWNYCTEARCFQEILDFICAEYGVEKQATEDELTIYVDELVREGLVEIAEC